LRSFLHAILINEANVFQTEPILVSRHDTQKTASLSALLYLMTGLNYEETDPKEEKKIKEAKKKAVVAYINSRLESMAERIGELDSLVVADTQSLQAKVEEIIDEISATERQITLAIERSRSLMGEIYDLNEQLAECSTLYNRIQSLRTQYNADIKRLTFIVEGEVHRVDVPANAKCPFCDGEITKHHEHSYVEASRSEAERIQLQLKDLSEADHDLVSERTVLVAEIETLTTERSGVDKLLNSELKPRISFLKQMLADYRRAIEIHNEVAVIHQFENSMKSELFAVENEEESSQQQFDIKGHFDNKMRAAIDEILARLLKACKYDGFSSVYFSQKAFDIVVNGNLKDSFGKGYRAFLNTVLAIALMEYLGEYGKFAPGLLIVDSPILSLKEKVSDETSDSMKAALFQYLLEAQGHGQVIIVENDIPGLDYSEVNVIRFTKDIRQGRYGFLNGVR
jgi:2C-methyl-D-erythritol 2,4-cyclodiphosphate synthase